MGLGHPEELFEQYSLRQIDEMKERYFLGKRTNEEFLAELVFLLRCYMTDTKKHDVPDYEEVLYRVTRRNSSAGDQMMAIMGKMQ